MALKDKASLDVQRLACRLSHLKEARQDGRAACRRSHELAPDDAWAYVDEAQARLLAHEPMEALLATEDAASRARKPDVFLSAARLYSDLGALSRAEEAAAHAPDAPEAIALRQTLVRARRRLGLPLDGARFNLTSEREPVYAAIQRHVFELIEAKDLKRARAEVAAALGDFPGAPGLQTLSCEIEARQRNLRAAEKACQAALAAMDDLPRAHYLLGYMRLNLGKREAAIAEFRRVLALDPEDRSALEALAELSPKKR
jgi:tetratricopeptide (TPR) repeat protein